MNTLLNFSLIKTITNGQWIAKPENPDDVVQGGAFDTRALGEAEIFFAWKGDNSDGHRYLDKLAGSQVKLAVVEQSVPRQPGLAILKVSDSLKALHQMAEYLAKRFAGKIVNITGSSGKTTTKTWLTHLLKDRFNLLTNPGSFNNQIGCPITILSMTAEHDLMILEMGASELGDLDLLSSIAPADVALLLNVGHAHLGKFGSLENTYRAKAEIFSHMRNGATAILPHGDLKLQPYMPEGPRLTFGDQSPDFSYRVVSVESGNFRQLINFKGRLGEKEIVVGQLGSYVGELLSAICAVCYRLGLVWPDIESKLKSIPQEKGRSTFLKGANGALLLDDTYNANPESVINMLNTISTLGVKRSIGVVGNLAELEENLSESADIIIESIPEGLTHLYMSGETGEILMPLIQKGRPELDIHFVSSIQKMIDRIKPLMNSETVIGIKGSRSAHMERVLLGLMEQEFTCSLNRCPRLNRCEICDQL